MDLVQDFKRMAICFVIMASTVGFVALSADTRGDYAFQNHQAKLHMPGPGEAGHRQRHGDPKPWMSILAHRALFVVTNLAGFVD